MVTFIKGDLLDIKKGVIVHQTNCFGATGGLAGSLRQKYPKFYEEYISFLNQFEQPKEVFGKRQYIKLEDDLYLVNSFSQYLPSTNNKETDEDVLIHNLKCVVEETKDSNLPIFIPEYIGCGLGGGDWEYVVSGIKDLPINIIVFNKK